METKVQLKKQSDNLPDLKLLLQQTHHEALQRNEYVTRHWMKLRDEHISLHSHLTVLPDKLSQEVMVPIGSKALMRGKMVHTNEIMVCLGDGWFVKRSAKEATEICDRRIKLCDNMLKDLSRERDLLFSRKQLPLEQDAFGTSFGEEILESYNEEKEAQWRVEHRQKEKEYRQKLSELRKKEKTVIEDEESLWSRLDELELQEELEEELDRLQAEREDIEDESADNDNNGGIDDDDDEEEETDEETTAMEADLVENLYLENNFGGGNGLIHRNGLIEQVFAGQESSRITHESSVNESSIEVTSSVGQRSSSRRVSFADERTLNIGESDSDSSAETLRIEFSHTPYDSKTQKTKASDEHAIETPAHIHSHIKELMAKDTAPKSILKNKFDIGINNDFGSQRMRWLDQPESVPIITQEIEEPLLTSNAHQPVEEMEERPLVFGDVLEHSLAAALPPPEPPIQTRPASRFKAARLAAKR